MTRIYDRDFLSPKQEKWVGIRGIPTIVEVIQDDLRPFLSEIHSQTGDRSGSFSNWFSQSFIDVLNSTYTFAH